MSETYEFSEVLGHAVLMGDYIPAHDETFDAAEDIGKRLAAFHAHVTEVRDKAQADAALIELGDAIKSAIYDATRR